MPCLSNDCDKYGYERGVKLNQRKESLINNRSKNGTRSTNTQREEGFKEGIKEYHLDKSSSATDGSFDRNKGVEGSASKRKEEKEGVGHFLFLLYI